MANVSKKYDNYSKEELIIELEALKKKKYGLVWDRKNSQEILDAFVKWENMPENFIPKTFPVLKEVKNKEIRTDSITPTNILIEGDNYHSLAVLNFTHKGAIDAIYIDPPYNTGNKDFAYNDKFVDREDPYRHSKWLSFMEKRLVLAKNLLKKTGIIFISIDDNEQAQLKLLCDEIFDENNFIATLPTIMNLKGNQDQFGFAGTHEYTLVYAKDISQAKIGEFSLEDEDWENWEEDDWGYFKKGANLKATGVNAPRSKRPNLFFPIFITPSGELYTSDNNQPKSSKDRKVLPITDGKEMSWRWSKGKISAEKHNLIVAQDHDSVSLYKKQRPTIGELPSKKPKTLLYKPAYSSGNGTAQLKEIFGEKVFNNPKPVDLIKDLIFIATDKSGVILDFMAGSGTTAQAVLELNKEDEGNRKFILCTNNENNICTDICYPRLRNIIRGYTNSRKEKVEGMGSNLKYLKTDFVSAQPTDKNKRDLVNKSTEMLCVREDIYDVIVEKNVDFSIFGKNGRYLGVIFSEDAIDSFIEEANNLEGRFSIYCFSYGEMPPEREFSESMKNQYALKPIPEVILKVYREIFKK